MVDFHHELFERCLNNQDEEDKVEDEFQDDDEAKKIIENFEKANKMSKSVYKQKPAKRKSRPLKMLKLHGSMDQKDRLKILEEVKSAEDCILFCKFIKSCFSYKLIFHLVKEFTRNVIFQFRF